jgi:acetyl-CoA carboxylase/biotin carboxylase 1
VLGKVVYTSNYQLGGTQIMFANGVSHETVDNDLQGVEAMLRWLSYVPAKKGAPLPILRMQNKKLLDPIERKVILNAMPGE